MQKLPLTFALFTISTFLCGQDIILEPSDTKSGYINVNELNFGYGLGSTDVPYSKYFYGLTTIHGYQMDINPFNLKSNLAGGAGAGMLFYDGGALFPIYIDLRYTLLLKKVSPFLFGTGGLLLNIDGIKDQSMLYSNGGLGVKINLSNRLDLTIGSGLLVQFGKDDSRDAFVNLRAGVSFKPGYKKKVVGVPVLLAQGAGHRAQSTGHRAKAQSAGHRAQSKKNSDYLVN